MISPRNFQCAGAACGKDTSYAGRGTPENAVSVAKGPGRTQGSHNRSSSTDPSSQTSRSSGVVSSTGIAFAWIDQSPSFAFAG